MQLFLLVWAQIFHRYTKTIILIFEKRFRKSMHSKALGLDENYSFLGLFQTGSINVVIPPANCVCGRVYCFQVVRPNKRTNESVSVTFCFLNILKSH